MVMEDSSPGQHLHTLKEVRTDSFSPFGATIQIKVSQPATFAIRQKQHRHILRANHVFDSPNAFSKHYLATSSILHHISGSQYPRSFLCRTVQDQKVLELRSVDLSRSANENKDAIYTIQLQFSTQIRHNAVAISDDEESKTITIYAINKANELHTISLPIVFFHDPQASEQDVTTWCKVAVPATFSISAPHTLVAATSVQLIVSLCDGRLLLLTKARAGDGSRWNEAIYGDGNWATSLRGLVKWQGNNTVRHDDNVLEQPTALSLALSPDGHSILAVTLDHRLRIWNATKGSIVYSGDVLGQESDPSEPSKFLLDAHSKSYLRLIELEGAPRGFKYCAVTFSQYNGGAFKFWGVRDADAGADGVKDMFPDAVFNMPDPTPSMNDSSLWRMIDYSIQKDPSNEDVNFWVLLQNGRQSALFRLAAPFLEFPDKWNDGWTCSSPDVANEASGLPQIASLNSGDEEWCYQMLRSRGIPDAVSESALLMYRTSRSMDAGDHKTSIQERLVSAVGQQVSKLAIPGDSESQKETTQQEWSNLRQYILDLESYGNGVLALCFDPSTKMPWVSSGAGSSIFRTLTNLEQITTNTPDILSRYIGDINMASIENDVGGEPKLPSDLAVVQKAAANLRSSFSSELQHNIQVALSTELWTESKQKMPARLEDFAKRCGFETLLQNDQLEDLDANLEPVNGLQNLDTDSFFSIFDRLPHFFDDERPSNLTYSMFGIRTLVRAARTMIYERGGVLMDLLACAVVATSEVDQAETSMQFFDGPQIFERLLELLRQTQVVEWLVDHVDKDEHQKRSRKASNKSPNEKNLDWRPTLLETIFSDDLVPHDTESSTGPQAFTLGAQDLLQWALGGSDTPTIGDVTARILCHLLSTGNIPLATQFLTFQTSTPWATYIKGRYYLRTNQIDEAVHCFESAGPKLSKSLTQNQQSAFRDLLSPTEAAHLGHGLPNYYSHIIDLFNDSQPPHPPQAAHFAILALEKLPHQTHSEERDHLLFSLFKPSLQTHDFTTAHSALTRHSNPRSLLPDFINTILSQRPPATSQLLSLSWPESLHPYIDAALASSAPPKILASWRLTYKNDYRGAAAALLPLIASLQRQERRTAEGERALEREYLTVINLLECAGKGNAWVLSGGGGGGAGGKVESVRKVVTVEDLRKEYQAELNRRYLLEKGGYTFGDGGNGNMNGVVAVVNGHAGDAMDTA